MRLQLGFDKGVVWQATGGPAAPVAVVSYDANEAGDLVDVTNALTAGSQALLPGIARGEGSFVFIFDADNAPQAAGIRFGIAGSIVFVTGGTPVTWQVRVAKVHYKSAVAGRVEVACDVKTSVL